MIPILVLQQLIASSTHLVAKTAAMELHPVLVVLIRALFSCVFFAGYCLVRRRHLPKVERKDWGRIVLLGALNIPLNQLLFIWGVGLSTPANASLAYALSPAFVVAIAMVAMGERPSALRLVGIGVAILGAGIVIVDRGASPDPALRTGNIMVLGASFTWALYTVLGKRLAATYGGFFLTALTMFAGTILFLPVALLLPVHLDTAPLVEPPPANPLESVWFQLLYLGFVTSGFGFGLWYMALAKIDASRLAVFNNLQPVLTTVLAALILGTLPTPTFLVGGAVALIGVAVAQRR